MLHTDRFKTLITRHPFTGGRLTLAKFAICQPFYIPLVVNTMDERFIQQVKTISREIVANEFPEEEEYFDFLFDLTIQEIEELEPGKEAEFLREMRAVHPELVLGYTPIVIIISVQILTEVTHRKITENTIKKKVAAILEDDSNDEKISAICKHLAKYLRRKEKIDGK